MSYGRIIFEFALIVSAIQSSLAAQRRHDATDAADRMLDENVIDLREELDQSELQIRAEEAIIDEIHRAWKLCLASNRPSAECHTLYESMLREEKPLVRLKHYHALLEEESEVYKICRRSGGSKEKCTLEKQDMDSKIPTMERELYPWKEIYEMCIDVLPKIKCYDIFEELQIPRYRNLVPESLITLAKAHICLDAGRSEEDCEAEAMDHFNQVVAVKDEL